MPKYVKTVVKKSSLIPWINQNVLSESSTVLTETEKQLRLDAKAETEGFPGYVSYDVTTVGNTQIIAYEFDTIDNLNNFINKTQDASKPDFDSNYLTAKFNAMVAKKIEELGLKGSYQVTTSVESS